MRPLFVRADSRRIACFLWPTVGLAFLAGCGMEQRLPVSGSVQFEGEPVEVGQITFQASSQYSGDIRACDIFNGRFELAEAEGLPPGVYRVQITAVRERDGDAHAVGLAGLPPELPEQYIPAKYNDQTTLEVEVTPDTPNHFEFELERER